MDDRTGDPGEFLNHPRWQRFVIAIAGPAMNVLLAFALLDEAFSWCITNTLPYSMDRRWWDG